MLEPNEISQNEINEINRKLAEFIGGEGSYDFEGEDVDDELPSFANPEEYELLDDSFNDIDFSEFKGDVKKNLHTITKKVNSRQPKKKHIKKVNVVTLTRTNRRAFGVTKKATIIGNKQRKIGKVIVPRDRKVIVEGVSDFILTDSKENSMIKNIGYYKGRKLQQLVLIFNNNSALDFNLELFNPSAPLDYLYSTSQNLNNRVQVAGGEVSYSDVLFNILANPVMVPSATVTISGPQSVAQQAVALQVKNKYVNGVTKINPVNLALQVDNMQVEGNNISFFFEDILNRCYIPDGMEVINYTVLAGNTVTICFWYEQKSIKKLFFEEARVNPKMK